jgi:ketosteroid isomerase-like protein
VIWAEGGKGAVTINQTAELTESELREFVKSWFGHLDAHDPVEQLLPLLADDELVMKLPEVTSRGHSGFSDWYEKVTHLFFDEEHTVEDVAVDVSADPATVRLNLIWRARVWRSPAARSESLGFHSGQTWALRRSPVTGGPMIVLYSVDSFTPLAGSPSLPRSPWEVIDMYYRTANAGDWDGWLSIMADNITADEQLPGHLEGIKAMQGEADVIKQGYASFQMHPLHIVADGQHASVVWHCQATASKGGSIDAIGANYFVVDDGKITYIRTIHDTAPFKAFTEGQQQ